MFLQLLNYYRVKYSSSQSTPTNSCCNENHSGRFEVCTGASQRRHGPFEKGECRCWSPQPLTLIVQPSGKNVVWCGQRSQLIRNRTALLVSNRLVRVWHAWVCGLYIDPGTCSSSKEMSSFCKEVEGRINEKMCHSWAGEQCLICTKTESTYPYDGIITSHKVVVVINLFTLDNWQFFYLQKLDEPARQEIGALLAHNAAGEDGEPEKRRWLIEVRLKCFSLVRTEADCVTRLLRCIIAQFLDK